MKDRITAFWDVTPCSMTNLPGTTAFTIGFPETVVNFYQTTHYHNPRDSKVTIVKSKSRTPPTRIYMPVRSNANLLSSQYTPKARLLQVKAFCYTVKNRVHVALNFKLMISFTLQPKIQLARYLLAQQSAILVTLLESHLHNKQTNILPYTAYTI